MHKESYPSELGSAQDTNSLSFGLVAWMDVLGFKQLLSANEDKAHVWLDVLRFLKASQGVQEAHQPTKFQQIRIGLRPQDYRFTAFADTIVTSVDLSKAKSDKSTEWHWIMLFLMRSAYLCRKMFEYGLPTRGGISIGRFYHAEMGFAGRPFVAAEYLSSRLELSACVFDDACMDYLRTAFRHQLSDLDSNYLWFRHNCPVKDPPGWQDRYVLNISSKGTLRVSNEGNDYKIDLSCADLHQVVRDSFSAHGKMIESDSVETKIANTVSMLQYKKSKSALFA